MKKWYLRLTLYLLCSVAQSCPILCDPVDCGPPGSFVHGIFPARILEWVAMPSYQPRRIFPTQESNWAFLHCMQIPYCLSHQGSPRILEWVAYPFSRGSSQPRNATGVFCIAAGFFISWATREAHALVTQILFGSLLWRRQWHPAPVLLSGKSHGWRSLVGCSPWSREESDTTERLHFHFLYVSGTIVRTSNKRVNKLFSLYCYFTTHIKKNNKLNIRNQ